MESDNQWQPGFINWRDETLFCAWSDVMARRVFVAVSNDGLRWKNIKVTNAPAARGQGQRLSDQSRAVDLQRHDAVPVQHSVHRHAARVGYTRYAGVLRSEDGGKSWTWSEPIEAVTWTQAGEKPAEFGGETITIWEPMVFEQADGKLGLLIRNSTARTTRTRRKPHRMLLYATSSDQGRTWTKARTVEVDTICSRNYAVSGVGTRHSLLMVMNDNNVRVPMHEP